MTKPTMRTYIGQESSVLQTILDSYPSHFDESAKALVGTDTPWLVLATGSSYNAALSAKYYVEKLTNRDFDVRQPYQFAHFERIDPRITRVLAISQSGQSTSTLSALHEVERVQNVESIAVTSMPDKELSQEADFTLDIQTGHELVGYVTLGYTATILTLMLLGLRVAALEKTCDQAQEAKELKQFESIVSQFDQAIEQTEAFFSANKKDLCDATQFSSIAYGPSVGSVSEMQTKFTEVIRLPSDGNELEAFMHGPYLAVNAEHRIFFVLTPGPKDVIQKAIELFQYESEYTKHTFLVNYLPDVKLKANELSLPPISDPEKLPLIGAVPFQVLAWDITTARGVDLGVQIFTDFSAKVHNKTVVQHYL
ncbi:SIS domain-containing protein [Lacticaseibacillus hegangensis]|uniref:SIS domain-containing protein n=1 Tax=Lacticaseibacillus hegangensis TaxID=2486010 RepID=A0ABW4CVG7_9LACO|nr:SIS domain-containing protein [Lacticaseibacillus hegangensis]